MLHAELCFLTRSEPIPGRDRNPPLAKRHLITTSRPPKHPASRNRSRNSLGLLALGDKLRAGSPHGAAIGVVAPTRRAAMQHPHRGHRQIRAADHSITSSAIASTPGGMVRPSTLTVLRLIKRSNLVGCMTGRSVGFSPLRTFSSYRHRLGDTHRGYWFHSSSDSRRRRSSVCCSSGNSCEGLRSLRYKMRASLKDVTKIDFGKCKSRLKFREVLDHAIQIAVSLAGPQPIPIRTSRKPRIISSNAA
jgi:hypothetical protein